MERTHVCLLCTQKNVLEGDQGSRNFLCVCVSVFFYAICHLVQRQRLRIESLKSRNHLYVKAHLSLSSGEKSLQ